ncbi:MAG: DUF934 domain-containing protein [Rhizobiaceae bacterium]|nr:DUF934 domain-containing protein [Rhizobiaceae bacterium]
MSTLFVDGAVHEDRWVSVDGEQPVPEGEDVIVSLAVFEAQSHALVTRNAGRLGVYLEAGDQIEAIADHLDHIVLVALDFPSFADGRAFSKARLLRDRYQFEGQIRATGDIRIDQVSHMRRSGFDAFQVSHQPTIDSLIEDKDSGLDLFYQPAVGDSAERIAGKNWARRAL